MKQPVYIESVGSLYFDASQEANQPELKPLVQAHCRGKYRRIDRFTQLALIGAARCAGTYSLPVDTALYLASGKGPAGNNIEMQRSIIAEHEPAKPIQFINAVSNSVSFYVMQDNVLSGQNLFVSREQHAFEAALTLTALDLEVSRFDSALLGMVDELTHPLSDQCARLGVPEKTPLGEGSHWFLCHANRGRNSLGAIYENVFFFGLPELLNWLAMLTVDCELFFAHEVNDEARDACIQCVTGYRGSRAHTENLWDGLTAGAIAGFLVSGQGEGLLTISCDRDNRYHAILSKRF